MEYFGVNDDGQSHDALDVALGLHLLVRQARPVISLSWYSQFLMSSYKPKFGTVHYTLFI